MLLRLARFFSSMLSQFLKKLVALQLATQDAYYLQNAMRPEAQKKTQKAAQPAAAKAA